MTVKPENGSSVWCSSQSCWWMGGKKLGRRIHIGCRKLLKADMIQNESIEPLGATEIVGIVTYLQAPLYSSQQMHRRKTEGGARDHRQPPYGPGLRRASSSAGHTARNCRSFLPFHFYGSKVLSPWGKATNCISLRKISIYFWLRDKEGQYHQKFPLTRKAINSNFSFP